jgi:hypothetical protein
VVPDRSYYNFTFTLSDICRDKLGNFYVTDRNRILKIFGTSVQLTGDATGHSGSYPVVLEANDGKGGVSRQEFSIVVAQSPTVETIKPVSITSTSAELKATITATGDAPILEMGILYSLTALDNSPTHTESLGSVVHRVVASGTSLEFSETIIDLKPHTEYSFATYAINKFGIKESEVRSFKTLNTSPIFTSTAITTVDSAGYYSYSFTATDDDGDQLSIWTELPDWIKMSPGSGNSVTTFSGIRSTDKDKVYGSESSFRGPKGVAVDSSGNVYVADAGFNRIRKISPNRSVTTLAGSGRYQTKDGLGLDASFKSIEAIVIDALGNLYVAESKIIRKVTPEGEVTTYAGSGVYGGDDGAALSASFRTISGLAVDTVGNLYVADAGNSKIRKISKDGIVTTVAGSEIRGSTDANGTDASFEFPVGVAVDKLGNLYVSDYSAHNIRKIAPNGEVSTFAGSGIRGNTDSSGVNASFSNPFGIAVDDFGNVFVADINNNSIRKITPQGDVTTLAGGRIGSSDGIGSNASFWEPFGITVDHLGRVFVADTKNNIIRLIQGSYHLSGNALNKKGRHVVEIRVTDGFGGFSSQYFDIVLSNYGIKVYSSGNILTVDIDFYVDDATVSIFNISGELIKQFKNVYFAEANWTTTFNDRGIFILVIESKYSHHVRKFIR